LALFGRRLPERVVRSSLPASENLHKRALTIGIGLSGLFLTGLIAGIAVYAMRIAINDHDGG
jgi:hypothetical protein